MAYIENEWIICCPSSPVIFIYFNRNVAVLGLRYDEESLNEFVGDAEIVVENYKVAYDDGMKFSICVSFLLEYVKR